MDTFTGVIEHIKSGLSNKANAASIAEPISSIAFWTWSRQSTVRMAKEWLTVCSPLMGVAFHPSSDYVLFYLLCRRDLSWSRTP